MVAVLFLDPDRFKIINDTMGHTVGDLLLRDVASRRKTYMREDDTIARFGGDEFSLLLPEISHEEDVKRIARKILDRNFSFYLKITVSWFSLMSWCYIPSVHK